jgi:hypothetical protein
VRGAGEQSGAAARQQAYTRGGAAMSAYVPIHQDLPSHRKTLLLAQLLDVEPACAVGHLVCFWAWSVDNSKDGYLDAANGRMVEYAAQWHGKPRLFAKALLDAGFLEMRGKRLYIHGWDEHQRALVEHRQKDAARKRKEREAARDARERDESSPLDLDQEPWSSNGHPMDVTRTS